MRAQAVFLLHQWTTRAGARGAVAILTALVSPLIMVLLGFSVDYAYASYVNQRLARAGDAAVLASVSQTAATAAGGYSNTSFLQDYGTRVFNENIQSLNVGNVNWKLNVTANADGSATASGSYQYAAPAFFSKFMGNQSVQGAGALTATAKPITYVNYYILVDGSQSMGIGATATDMQNLYNRVVQYGNGSGGETGCTFGCHEKAPGQKYTNEYLAHSVLPTITLRIDSAVSAIQSIINDAATAAGSTRNIQFALYVIQANPNDGTQIKTIAPLSNNYTGLGVSAGTIDLGSNQSGGIGDSDFPDELTAFNQSAFVANNITTNGSGASATSPLNYVFLITDGVTDVHGSCGYGHCTGPLDSSKCTTLKSKATVGVIYTTYLPVYNNNNSANGLEPAYRDLVNPFVGSIAPSLQACATSSDYYFEATDGPALNTAMSSLFNKTLPLSARLTQ